MTDEIVLWKQRIIERKEKKQTIADFCKEHNKVCQINCVSLADYSTHPFFE